MRKYETIWDSNDLDEDEVRQTSSSLILQESMWQVEEDLGVKRRVSRFSMQ